MTYALWIVQGLLALLFLFAGVMKLLMPMEELAKEAGMPGPFLRFIAVVEVLGAIGLILPGLLRIRPGLTPLAAAGLVIIMIGATVTSFVSGGVVMALMPLVVGLLAAFVAYGRWRVIPHRRRLARRGFRRPGEHGQDPRRRVRERSRQHEVGHGSGRPEIEGEARCEFMILVKADKNTEAGAMPSEKLLAEMGKYNEELAKAGVLLAGEGLHPSSKGARVKFSGAKRTVDRGALPQPEGSDLRLLDVPGEVEGRGDRMGQALPQSLEGEAEIEIRQVFEADDFGAELTPELARSGATAARHDSRQRKE